MLCLSKSVARIIKTISNRRNNKDNRTNYKNNRKNDKLGSFAPNGNNETIFFCCSSFHNFLSPPEL